LIQLKYKGEKLNKETEEKLTSVKENFLRKLHLSVLLLLPVFWYQAQYLLMMKISCIM